MDVIYGLIPGMILLGLAMVVAFIFAARSGQFDDLEGAAHRILMDDDEHPPGAGERAEQGKPGEEEESEAKSSEGEGKSAP